MKPKSFREFKEDMNSLLIDKDVLHKFYEFTINRRLAMSRYPSSLFGSTSEAADEAYYFRKINAIICNPHTTIDKANYCLGLFRAEFGDSSNYYILQQKFEENYVKPKNVS